MFDLIIVGAGPAGIAAAYQSKKEGLKYLVLEQEELTNTIQNYPLKKELFSTKENIEIKKNSFGDIKGTFPTREEVLNYFEKFVKEEEIKINLFEEVLEINKIEDSFEVISEKNRYQAKKIILGIGNRGVLRKLGIKGEDLPKVKHQLLDPSLYENEKILVIGGGDTAIETALRLKEKNEVVLSYRKNEFTRLSKKNLEDLTEAVREKKMKCILNSNLKEVEKEFALLEENKNKNEPGHLIELENSKVFIMIGAFPNKLFLESIGLELEKGRIPYDPETYKSNILGIYIVGDLTKAPLIVSAVKEGIEVIKKMKE